MAKILPEKQVFLDRRDGTIAGITQVRLVSSQDSFALAKGANTAANASACQIRDAGEAAVTVEFYLHGSESRVTITGGVVGNTVTVASLHRFLNHDSEG